MTARRRSFLSALAARTLPLGLVAALLGAGAAAAREAPAAASSRVASSAPAEAAAVDDADAQAAAAWEANAPAGIVSLPPAAGALFFFLDGKEAGEASARTAESAASGEAPADLESEAAAASDAGDAGAAAADDPGAAAAGAAGGRPSLLGELGGDARAAGRSFSLLVRREVWPRTFGRAAYLGGLAGASAILEAHKEALRRDVLRSAFYRHSHWTQIGGTLGLTRVGYGAAAAFYLGGLAAGRTEVRRTGLLLAESLLLAQGVAGAVNFAVSEARPRAGGAIRYFHGGGSGVSIHMTNAAALARVLDHRLTRFAPGDGRGRRLAKILGKVAIYSIPAITGWQRLRADQHYLWSVVLGAGLSAYVTDALLRSYDQVTAAEPPPP